MSNILFITSSMGYGGAAKMLSFVAESLCKRSHNVCIANLENTTGPVGYIRTVSEDIKVISFANIPRMKQILGIKNVAKSFQADIIIGFTEIPNGIARIVGFMLGIPSIISERGDPTITHLGKDIKSSILRAIINSSRGGVFQTEGAQAYYGRGLKRRGIVIPNPIFIKGEVPNIPYCEREKSIVSVGRLDNYQKRYDVMLDAFKIFADKHSDYVLKLYGRGSDEDLIKSWVDERDLSDKVKFMGLTSQPMQDICRDGMFLITSDYEGISNSLLEAMATGLPCVSTDHAPGGARLLITDHENGLLAPVQDATALSAAMCEFAENPKLSEKCGENAKDVIVRFAPDRITDMWENYIISLLKNT